MLPRNVAESRPSDHCRILPFAISHQPSAISHDKNHRRCPRFQPSSRAVADRRSDAGAYPHRGPRALAGRAGVRHAHRGHRSAADGVAGAQAGRRVGARPSWRRTASTTRASNRGSSAAAGRTEKLTIEMVEPRYLPLLGYADGWSASTSGEIVAAPGVHRRQDDARGAGGARAAAEGRDRHDAADPDQLRAEGSAAAERSRLRADVGGLRDVGGQRPRPGAGRRDGAAAEPARDRRVEGGRRRRDPEAEHRRARHGVRHRPRRRSGRGAVGHAQRRALQHDRALPRSRTSR